MPHVKLRGVGPLEEFHSRFEPRKFQDDAAIVRAIECYLATHGRALMIELATVEGRLQQSYYVLVTRRDDEVAVRLLPKTSPEKTRAVKRSVAWIATWIQSGSPGATVTTTNLESELAAPFPTSDDPKK